MKKRKKKNLITVMALLLALVALIIVYISLSNKKSDEEAEKKIETIALSSLDADKITFLNVKTEQMDIQLELKEEQWISTTQPDRPINQTYVNNMVKQIAVVNALKVVKEDVTNVEEYGLNQPSLTVEAGQEDGAKVLLQLGDPISGGDGYYAFVNSDKKVYYLSASYEAPFQYSDIEMTEVITAPTIKAENIHHITLLRNEGEDLDIYYEMENSEDKSDGGIYSWLITKPYPEGYTADASVMTEYLPKFTNFSFIHCVDYKGENLSLYGLDNPSASIYVGFYETFTEELKEPKVDPKTGQTVNQQTYYEEKEIKVYLGNKDDMDNYYVKLEGSNAVYTMKSDNVDKMLEVKAFSLLNPYINLPFIDTVDSVTVEYDGLTKKMEMKRTVEKNEDDEDETKVEYYFNGTLVEEKVFKGLYQIIIGAEYDSPIKEGVTVRTDELKPVLSVSYHLLAGKSLSTTFYTYNDSFYVIETEKATRFFADKREIDDILKGIKASELNK